MTPSPLKFVTPMKPTQSDRVQKTVGTAMVSLVIALDAVLCNSEGAQTAALCQADSTPTPQSSASDHDILVALLVDVQS